MHVIRKGQIRWLTPNDVVGQRQFIHALFGIAADLPDCLHSNSELMSLFATDPSAVRGLRPVTKSSRGPGPGEGDGSRKSAGSRKEAGKTPAHLAHGTGGGSRRNDSGLVPHLEPGDILIDGRNSLLCRRYPARQ